MGRVLLPPTGTGCEEQYQRLEGSMRWTGGCSMVRCLWLPDSQQPAASRAGLGYASVRRTCPGF